MLIVKLAVELTKEVSKVKSAEELEEKLKTDFSKRLSCLLETTRSS